MPLTIVLGLAMSDIFKDTISVDRHYSASKSTHAPMLNSVETEYNRARQSSVRGH
jgi:hypothetical protein